MTVPTKLNLLDSQALVMEERGCDGTHVQAPKMLWVGKEVKLASKLQET
jgi:hypothetical protein